MESAIIGAAGVVLAALIQYQGWLSRRQFGQLETKLDQLAAKIEKTADRIGELEVSNAEVRTYVRIDRRTA